MAITSKEITLSNKDAYRLLRAIDGKRDRVETIAQCSTLDEILALDFMVAQETVFGAIGNLNTISTEIPFANETMATLFNYMGYGQENPTKIPTCLLENPNLLDLSEISNLLLNDESIYYNTKQMFPAGYIRTYDQVVNYEFLPNGNFSKFNRIGAYVENDISNTLVTIQLSYDSLQDAYFIQTNILEGLNINFISIVNDEIVLETSKIFRKLNPEDGAYGFAWTKLEKNKFTTPTTGGSRLGGDAPGFINVNLAGSGLLYNTLYDLSFNCWVFATRAELENYLKNGEYHSALNYSASVFQKDYMDLNMTGNSVMRNAVYDFIDPVPGIVYSEAKQIKMIWSVTGADVNPFTSKVITFDIPANTAAYVQFDGKTLTLYSNRPTSWTMNVLNHGTLIGTFTGQSENNILIINDIFGLLDTHPKPSGVNMLYNVKIYTPFIFVREIYKCSSREELPKKGTPGYEIYSAQHDGLYVNPNDTGELAKDHLLSFLSIADMKAASDAVNGGV